MKFVRSGKVKDIYETDDGNILFSFSDRVSAFDVQMETRIPRKGEALCKFAAFWFNTLETPHHMIRVVDKDRMEVKRLSMIPLECVVRGYFYGSLVERFRSLPNTEPPSARPLLLGEQLPNPLFDPTTKSEEHDYPIDEGTAVSRGFVTAEEFVVLEKTSISLYRKMSAVAKTAGFIMADVKFEFGRDSEGQILLADSLGPDEFRLWPLESYKPGVLQESFDKQVLRDWLESIGFKAKVERLAHEGKKPQPPALPEHLVLKLSQRYITAYERISLSSL